MFAKIQQCIDQLTPSQITEERKEILEEFIQCVQQHVDEKRPIRVSFICTHNSRRSHLAQIWAQTMAFYFGINQFVAFSAGTETTALYPVIVKTLESQGFEISNIAYGNNPVYAIKYSNAEHPIIGFSKEFACGFNPKDNYIAVTTCMDVESKCPVVIGATHRFAIAYDDPKVYDGTDLQASKYEERSLQIATEMFYVFASIDKNNG